VGRLLFARHKVLRADESDVYFAFAVRWEAGDPRPQPPEIAEVRDVAVDEAIVASWVSELSRIVVRLALGSVDGWARSSWPGGPTPGIATEAYHPGPD
jgi:hypothetical protein